MEAGAPPVAPEFVIWSTGPDARDDSDDIEHR